MSLRLAGASMGRPFLIVLIPVRIVWRSVWQRRPQLTDFADRKCKPCEGGVAPLAASQAREFLTALHPDWSLAGDGKSIVRNFDFPAFSRTIAFTNAVAWIATVEGHHPEMTVSYSRCVVVYRTTAIDGLSDNDFICAAKVDRISATD